MYSVAICISIIVEKVKDTDDVKNVIVQIIVGGISLVFGLPLLKLLIYHILIIKDNLTTN